MEQNKTQRKKSKGHHLPKIRVMKLQKITDLKIAIKSIPKQYRAKVENDGENITKIYQFICP